MPKAWFGKQNHGYNDTDYVGNVKGVRDMFFPDAQRVRYRTPADDEVIGMKLDTINEYISNYFGWTITPTLHEAMKPTSLKG
jgi:hypothetical protein